MVESKLERNFWRYWLGGLLILAIMIAMNPWFSNEVSPWGIRDHQSAGTAVRVDAIQAAWQAAGVMDIARIGIAIDLVYIGIYSFGAYCGGRLFAASTRPSLRRLGGCRGCCRNYSRYRRLYRDHLPVCSSDDLPWQRFAGRHRGDRAADKVGCFPD